MYKKLIVGSVTLSTVLVVGTAFAVPPTVPAELSTPGTTRTLLLPEQAANGEFIDLGVAIDPVSGKEVQGIAIFHHREGHGGGPGGGDSGGGDSTCFAHLARGASWKTVEPWVVNTSNIDGLSDSFVFENLTADIAKWESAAGADILGDGATTTLAIFADTVSPDGVNEVYFSDISSEGSIGVTIVWGVFSGPPFARELVEWDQVYDDVDFDWSDSGEAGAMDFENIATHELGHSVGMGHPEDSCADETMFRFASEGETKKRSLELGDATGVTELYN